MGEAWGADDEGEEVSSDVLQRRAEWQRMRQAASDGWRRLAPYLGWTEAKIVEHAWWLLFFGGLGIVILGALCDRFPAGNTILWMTLVILAVYAKDTRRIARNSILQLKMETIHKLEEKWDAELGGFEADIRATGTSTWKLVEHGDRMSSLGRSLETALRVDPKVALVFHIHSSSLRARWIELLPGLLGTSSQMSSDQNRRSIFADHLKAARQEVQRLVGMIGD